MKPLLALLLFVCCFGSASSQPCGNNSRKGVSGGCDTCFTSWPKINSFVCPGINRFNAYTGNVSREVKDLQLWGSVGELDMVWSHFYTSRGSILWNYSFVYSLYDGPVIGGKPTLLIDYPEGGQNVFTQNPSNPNEWLPLPGVNLRLFQYGNDFYLQMVNGFRYRFTKFSLVIGSITYYYYLLQDIRDSRQNLYRLTYTPNRQLDSVIEPGGRFFKVDYTILGGRRLIGQVTTSDGRSVQYQYDIFNDGVSKWIRFLGATYGDGTHAYYTYSQAAPGGTLRLASAVDPRYTGTAVKMSYTYNWSIAAGYIFQEKNLVTGQVMATLIPTDSTRDVCYPNGRLQHWKFPPELLGNPKDYTDGLGQTRKYGYDMGGQGFLANDTDALNRVTRYDSRTIYGNLLKMTHPDGSQQFWTRDSLDLELTHTDELGRITTFTRDALHRVTRVDYPDLSFETFTYNSFGQVLNHQRVNGGTEFSTYDSRGLKTSFRDAAGNLTSYGYDAADRLDSVTDARGNTTTYLFNERGLITKLIHPDLSFQTYVYDSFANQTSGTDEMNHTWSTTYDDFKRPLSTADPLNRITQYAYDLPGGICACAHNMSKPTSITLPSGKMTRFGYDVEWQLIKETSGAGSSDSAITSYEYDLAGNKVKKTDPRGKDWLSEYDNRDRRKASVDPLGHRSEWTYDATGNLLTEKRPDGGTTTHVYDVNNRRTKSTDPKAQVSQYIYDAEGNMLSVTDPNANVYSFQYDLLNRKTRMSYPGGSFEQYSYDPVSNLDVFVNRAGTVQSFTYDSRDREVLSDWNDATPDVSRSYDAAGRLLTLSSSVSALSYAYDDANEQLSETQNIVGSGGGAKTVSYTYNADGLLNTLTYPSGGTLSYGYTGRNQLASVTDGSTPALVSYTYDLAGNRISKTLKNGSSTAYAYDDDDKTLTVDHRLGVASFARFDYGYDNVHRRTFMQRDLSKGDVYSYDAIDQLTGVLYDATNPGSSPSAPVRTVAYGLDAAGNRTSVTDNSVPTSYTANNLNEYTIVGGNAFSYSSNGNLATGSGWTYSYDAQDRLISASNGIATEQFAYDANNRNVRRNINGVRTYFYYDGWSLIEEKDSADALQQRFVLGAMSDEILSKTISGTPAYYHQDALGSTVRLTNAAGAVVEQYSYDAFGNPTIRNGSGVLISNSNFANRFLFTGREYLPEIGLYDYRNRNYHPLLGRFMQTDPLHFDANDLNLYRYVVNNPVNLTDPSGLKIGVKGTKDEPPCKEKKDDGNARYPAFKITSKVISTDKLFGPNLMAYYTQDLECCKCGEWIPVSVDFYWTFSDDDSQKKAEKKLIDNLEEYCIKLPAPKKPAPIPPPKKPDPTDE